MNAEDHLIAALACMEAEKATQPLKNYAISDLRRVLAVWKMADGSVYQKATKTPENAREGANTGYSDMDDGCVCKPGMRSRLCSLHGITGA